MRIAIAAALLLTLSVVHAQRAPAFELDKERERLWAFLADKHAEIGDAYKEAKVYTDARRHYDRARELVPEHAKAMRGLGFARKRGEWTPENPLPEKEELDAAALAEARKAPDVKREREYTRCLDRCRRAMDAARRAENATAERILALDLLYYAPDDEAARALRGHVKDGDNWVPAFAARWREAGRKAVEAATEGEALEGDDEQATVIGTRFSRRQSRWLVVRTSYESPRDKLMHRHAEANLSRAMALLEIKENPFGANRRYTLTNILHAQWEPFITKVLKLEGDTLEFTRRLQGTGTREPWGYASRGQPAGADDMLGNTIALRVVTDARGRTETPQWLTTGFGYFVTSQVLGTCSTLRYRMERAGATASSHNVIPEFTKKSGTPELLREVALYDVMFKREPKLEAMLTMEVNDIDQSAAAKAFAFIEFAFDQHAEKARKWLTSPAAERDKRVAELETAFGMPLDELEAAWRSWVLANY